VGYLKAIVSRRFPHGTPVEFTAKDGKIRREGRSELSLGESQTLMYARAVGVRVTPHRPGLDQADAALRQYSAEVHTAEAWR
jgi:hypothetical protein